MATPNGLAPAPGQAASNLTLTDEDLAGLDIEALGCTRCTSFCPMGRMFLHHGRYVTICPKKPGAMGVFARQRAHTQSGPAMTAPPGQSAAGE